MEQLSFENLDHYLLSQNGKIIHQIWFGTIPNKSKARKAFEKLRKYRDSWLVKNPNWGYMCWNRENCEKIVKTYYPEHLDMYNKYPYEIQRCDTVRYIILHRYGGLYADMDYYCNRSFDEALSEYTNDIYFVETPNKVGKDTRISNSLMYSKPKHMFWRKLFTQLEIHCKVPYYYGRHMTIMFTTGPGLLSRVYNRYKIRHKIGYLPYKYFHPYGLTSDIITLNNKPDVFAIHIGKGSWECDDSKWLIFIYQEYKFMAICILVLVLPVIIRNIKLKLNNHKNK